MKDGTQQLPPSARDSLIRIADMLRDGYTGTIELECHEGGVRKMTDSRTWRPPKGGSSALDIERRIS